MELSILAMGKNGSFFFTDLSIEYEIYKYILSRIKTLLSNYVIAVNSLLSSILIFEIFIRNVIKIDETRNENMKRQ